MSRKRLKQYLMLLTAIGLVSVSAGSSGTFASFSAEVQHSNNYFATGTLFLHASNDGTNWCTSESSDTNLMGGVGNGKNDCGMMFHVDGVTTTAQYAHLTLKNAGTLDANDIKFDAPGSQACTNVTVYQANTTLSAPVAQNGTTLTIAPATLAVKSGDTIQVTNANDSSPEIVTVSAAVNVGDTSITIQAPGIQTARVAGAKVNTSAEFTGGGGGLCGRLHLMITETDASFTTTTQNDTGTTGATGCAYGPTSGSGCLFAGATALSGLPTTLSSLTLSNQGGWAQPTGLDHGQSRYFLVGVKADPTTNGDQGTKASFSLLWHIDQA